MRSVNDFLLIGAATLLQSILETYANMGGILHSICGILHSILCKGQIDLCKIFA